MSNVVHGVGPTAAQMAYIHRILAPPPNAAEIDPIAKLRAANNGDAPASSTSGPNSQETGLEESLRAFTSVEILEGENAFACKRCWKIKSGRYKGREATLPEEDESMIETMGSAPASPEVSALGLKPNQQVPPAISIAGSDSSSSLVTSPSGISHDEGRLGRAGSVASRSSASAQNVRAPSPLRRQIEMDDATRSISNLTIDSSTSGISAIDTDMGGSTMGTTVGKHDSDDDGLSDTDTSDEEQPDTAIHIGRPKPTRRQSSHFVMRRAFKRYLFAKSPEVLIFHFKRFKQTHKTSMMFTSFYDLKK
jgi:ubiquitin carboxyl-terminal hydrolase 16/45